MNDIAVDFVKKLMGKEVKFDDPLKEEARKLQLKVDLEEKIIENKIKLKTMQSITDSMLDKSFTDLNIDKFITSTIQTKIVKYIEKNAWRIVDEALEDLEDDYGLTTSIRTEVIQRIKNSVR